MKNILLTTLCFGLVVLMACGPSPEQQASMTAIAATTEAAGWTRTPTDTPTFSPTPTETFTPTLTPTETITPSPTPTSTATPTPTYALPTFTVKMQAHCRYGPAQVYLHAADLYAGDSGVVWGRYNNSNWLYVKPDKIGYACWVAPSVVEVTGDISVLVYQQVRLPSSSLYKPPKNVSADRDDDRVTISWEPVPMTEDDDRGIMLDLFVCQDGRFLWWPISFENQGTTSYTVKDEAGCAFPSSGKIAGVEKHGYTEWVTIHWPKP